MPRLSALFALFLFALPVTAIPPVDEAAFPTYRLLRETIVPVADRLDIARRFSGITHIPAVAPVTTPRQVGEVENFNVVNVVRQGINVVQAELRAVGAHVYVWVERDVPFAQLDAQGFADIFDRAVYQPTRDLWGSEDNPGIDGDPRIYALFTVQMPSSLTAYFAGQNSYPRAVIPTSNEHELLIFNLNNFAGGISSATAASVAAHEFQHMIRRNVDANEVAWVDEGFSMLTEHLLGYPDNQWALQPFFSNPATQLNAWGTGPRVEPEYGAAQSFLLYFYERFGANALRMLSDEAADGMVGMDNILRRMGEPGADDFFADWALANILQRPDLGYGYRTLPPDLKATAIMARVQNYPFSRRLLRRQYSTDYYELHNPPAQLSIQLQMPASVGLFPTEASSGRFAWYSNRGDDSNPTLTRAFDLRGLTAAELIYRTWYDLEENWDYVYLSISSDGGRTWQLQSTAHTTADNPNGRAIGAGYTGRSGGWLTEVVSLDAYAGHEILLRFEMLTDDSLNLTGFVLDDVALLQAGYFSDFEADDGGWQSRGWMHTDNRLPQRAWVQAVQHIGNEVQLSRWLAEGDATFTLDVLPQTERITLAVSPFAPLTTVETVYTLVLQ